MPRVHRNRRPPLAGRSRFAQSETHQPNPSRATNAAASAVGLLAPAACCSPPSLAGVPASFLHLSGTKPLYQLCHALAKHNIGDAALWESVDRNPLAFAIKALTEWIDKQGGKAIDKHIEYLFSIRDNCDSYDNPLTTGELYFTIETDTCGYLEIGAALDAMERETTGLGAAFYRVLVAALDPWMYLFCHREAGFCLERMIEWAKQEEDGEADLEQYEFPDVAGATPEYIRASLQQPLQDHLRLLNGHKSGHYRALILSLLRLRKHSRLKPRQSLKLNTESLYDAGPLPSVLIVFKQHDAVMATFDQEFENAYECSHEPQLALKCNPAQPAQVRETLRVLSTFFRINKELCFLLETLSQFAEKTDGADNCDRSQPQLRAA